MIKVTNLLPVFLAGIFMGMAQAQNSVSEPVDAKREIKLEYNQVKGQLNTFFKDCIGAGRANEGLRADWQQQLAVAKEECGFKYIRMHGLLCDDMGVYCVDRQGKVHYNYQYIDALYDYLLSIDVKPFVELGFMPSALASGGQTIFWWRGNVTPPNDYEKWADFMKDMVQHFTDRYGAAEVRTWYFEVWNEPNLNGFWSGSQDEYFKLYQYTVKAIKSIDPAYRVGGPATAGAGWVPETIKFCTDNQLPLDFISTHSYGVRQGYLDEYGTSGTILDSNPNSVSGDVLNSRRQITGSAMPELELHYTEWSASYTPSDPVHDSYYSAPYILNKLKQVGDAANSMSYWVFTDIFEESGPRYTPFHGGFGLVNYQGIKKPAFYAYSFLNKLGSTELVNNDNSSWACKDDKNGLQILLWDYTHTQPNEGINNQQYYVKDLPAQAKGTVEISVQGVPQGNYLLNIYQTGYRVNDAFATYCDFNKPEQLTRDQVETIKKINDGSPVSHKVVSIGADLKFSQILDIRTNDVFLIKLDAVK